MSKVALALGSFALGVVTTFFVLSGGHTFASTQQPSHEIGIGGGGVPVVPPISQHYKDFGVSGSILAFNVDGAECIRCVFNGPVLRYNGGNFQFTDFSFSGPVRVEFGGAAKNTLIFLQFVQSLAAGQAPKQNLPSKDPILRTATVKEPVRGSFGITE